MFKKLFGYTVLVFVATLRLVTPVSERFHAAKVTDMLKSEQVLHLKHVDTCQRATRSVHEVCARRLMNPNVSSSNLCAFLISTSGYSRITCCHTHLLKASDLTRLTSSADDSDVFIRAAVCID